MKNLIIVIVLVLFLLGSYYIIKQKDIDINTSEGKKEFFSVFSSWVVNIFSNIKSITANAVNMNWLPDVKSNDIHKENLSKTD